MSDPKPNDTTTKLNKHENWLKLQEQAITELRAELANIRRLLGMRVEVADRLRPDEGLRRKGRP